MKSKSLWAVCIVLALSLISVATTSSQNGQAELIIINFVGGEMTFTLDGMSYAVPGIDAAPGGGQLTLTLTPGQHTYSAHIPGSEGTNGEVELVAGQTQLKGARLERSGPVISPTGLVLEEPRDVLVLFDATLTPLAPAATPRPAPLQPLLAGQGALVFVNYIGEDLTVDISGELYTVPANGRLQVNLPPGEVSYSASAGLSGMNGTAQIRAGAYTGLAFTREIPPEEPDYEVGEPVPTPVPLKMSVSPTLLEDEPAGEVPSAPSAVASPISAPAGQGELRLVNYIGETLTLTVDNQAYSVAGGGGRLTLNLVSGEYTFTASTPRAGANGSVRVKAGIATRVSVALDLHNGRMKIYIE